MDVAGKDVSMFGKKGLVEEIAEKILAQADVSNTIIDILTKLREQARESTYLATRKYAQENSLSIEFDQGHIGVATQVIPNVAFPADILVFAYPYTLGTNNILQIISHGKNNKLIIDYARVLTTTINGTVNVRSVFDGLKYTTSRWDILGKLLEVFDIGSYDWNQYYPRLMDPSTHKKLIDSMNPLTNLHLQQTVKNKHELERRVKYLKAIDLKEPCRDIETFQHAISQTQL